MHAKQFKIMHMPNFTNGAQPLTKPAAKAVRTANIVNFNHTRHTQFSSRQLHPHVDIVYVL